MEQIDSLSVPPEPRTAPVNEAAQQDNNQEERKANADASTRSESLI